MIFSFYLGRGILKKIFVLLSVLTFLYSYSNHLADSTSEYLLQHAHNPVNWYPWCDEAFKKAKEEDKLIFLSIGYSTCHWCHVMEKESFEDEKIAELLNEDYVSIKVDKEQMPHIDSKYQTFLSKITKKRNGWPLSVILTPKGDVLYITTYIPPKEDYGVEGMQKLLPRLAKLYHKNFKRAKRIIEANKKLVLKKSEKKILKNSLEETYIEKMQKRYDNIYKGFDLRPRFPLASNLNLLFDIYLLTGDKRAQKMFFEPLDAMARGGIYDQIEGGFFRYSTHPDWIVPHFEKMLYTQAELILLYVKAYIFTKNPLYKRVVTETADEMIKRFQKNALFFSASDADSEGREGGYFVYTFMEVFKALKKNGFDEKEIKEITEYFDITPVGNFEHRLSNPQTNTGFEKEPKRVKEVRKILKDLRKSRKFPFIDKKVITAWNAMMIKALLKASALDKKYEKEALVSLEKLIEKMYKKGVLYHQFLETHPVKQKAFFEDFVFLSDALTEAYETTYDKKYLKFAKLLANKAIKKFYDPKNKRWYLDDTDIKSPSVYQDRYYTAALSRFFHVLISLSNLTYDRKLLSKTKRFIENEREKIVAKIDISPEATRALIRIREGDVIIKSNIKNLFARKIEIERIKYPFKLTNVEDTEMFLACNEESCFAFDKNLSKIDRMISRRREKM